MRKSVDVITSAFNEEECLPELFRRLNVIAEKENNYDFKFIVIDNGSTDHTWNLIKEIQESDNRYIGIKMSRNFTLDSAFTCGLDHAKSDVAVIIYAPDT